MRLLYLHSTMILFALLLFSCTNDTGTVTVNYLEASAIYGDMDEVRSMPLNEKGRTIQNPGKIFIGNDFVLIGEEGEGIHVIKNQNRNNPISEAFINIPGNIEFFVDGQFLYAESYYDMLKIDIANPAESKLLSRSKNAIQDEFVNDKGETLIGFSYEEKTITLDENDDFMNEVIDDQLVYLDFAKNVIPKSSVPSSFSGNSAQSIGSINRIAKSNNYIYIVSNNNMIILDDINFGAKATRIENIKDEMETIFPYHDNLFIGSKTSMSVFEISNGNQPNEIFEFEHATSCDPVLPFQDVAYITLRTADFSKCPGNINALLVIDMNDMSNPIQTDEIQMASPYGMSVINDLLYVGNGTSGLSVFNIENTKKPILLKEHKDIEAYDIIADPNHPDYIFITGSLGMNQYLINEDQSLQLQSKIDY